MTTSDPGEGSTLAANNFVAVYGSGDNKATTNDIADSAVTATKLASNSVTTAKISDKNVTTAKLADEAVTADKIDVSTFKYSTSPTAVGVWIDGKTIYRKVVTYNFNNGTGTISTGISNMDQLIKVDGAAKYGNIWLPLNFYNSGGWNSFHITNNGANITYQDNGAYKVTTVNFTFYYTTT